MCLLIFCKYVQYIHQPVIFVAVLNATDSQAGSGEFTVSCEDVLVASSSLKLQDKQLAILIYGQLVCCIFGLAGGY